MILYVIQHNSREKIEIYAYYLPLSINKPFAKITITKLSPGQAGLEPATSGFGDRRSAN